MAFIGIDIGSTGCKSTVMSKEGQGLGSAYREYPPLKSSAGIFELDPEVVWDLVLDVLKDSIKEANVTSIIGISISSLGESAIPIDEDGKVLYNSILYMDNRGNEEIEEATNKIGLAYLTETTGLKPNGQYTLGKLLWIKKNEPLIYDQIRYYLSFAGFILYKLGADPAIDYTLASRTLAFNLENLKMDDTICQTLNIDSDIFGRVVPTATCIGIMKETYMTMFGLEGKTQLVCGAHDQVCNAIGAGIKENMALEGIGTVDCIMPIFNLSDKMRDMANNNFCRVPYVIGETFATYAYNLTGGNLNQWYRNVFGYEEQELANEQDKSVYQVLDENLPEKPTNLLVLPHFCGSGTPYFDAQSKGALIGMTLNTTKDEIYKAFLEGETYEMKFNLELLESYGINLETIRVVGGGAKSKGWLQIKADIMGITLETIDRDEAGTIGAIIIAGLATGSYKSYEAAMEQLIHVKERYEPIIENHIIYEQHYKKYKLLYPALKGIYNNSVQEYE